MALSKPEVPCTVQDTPVIAQHYLVCDTEDCKNSCGFYCNSCHQPMCEQCKEEHQKSPKTDSHEVVPYRQRKRKLPEEKCNVHPSKDIDIICEDCQVPLCYKCAIQDHRGHVFEDLETIYSKNFTLCLNEIYNIHQYILPTLQEIKSDIKEDAKKMKAFIEELRGSIKTEAESLKRLVDEVMSDNFEEVNKLEEGLKEELQNQYKTYKEYNGYLEDLADEINGCMSFDKVLGNPILDSIAISKYMEIKPIHETTKQIYPIFTAGNYNKDDVAKLFGKISTPDTIPEKRSIKTNETLNTDLKSRRKEGKRERGKSFLKRAHSLFFSVDTVKEYLVQGIKSSFHISIDGSGGIWVNDNHGNLVKTDMQGNQLEKIHTSGEDGGHHTVTHDGGLIYANRKNNSINLKTLDKTIPRFIQTKKWTPLSVHSSHTNGDILVGMSKVGEGKITRYNKTGSGIQSIQRNSKGQGMYSRYPHYITENTNGDICVSDYDQNAVVVINKIGDLKFSYTGQGTNFLPFGICTDSVGHILVCDNSRNTVHLLAQDS